MPSFPLIDSTTWVPGSAGKIEAIADLLHNDAPAVAIICHPHPLHGGTMNNKVVTTLARTCRELGLATVRFNFRGVGKSEGEFGHGVGEVSDLLAVVEWVKQSCPNAILWLAGFSFGGFIAASVATEIPVAQLITVAPQVSRFKETKLPSITVPWILVQGEQDEVVSPEEVFTWVETLEFKPQVIRVEGAGHFFHGKLVELRERLKSCLCAPQV